MGRNHDIQRINGHSRIGVILPTLEPGPNLAPFIADLRALGFDRIVLVDDGSSPDHEESFGAAEDAGCVLLIHKENRGKGRSLKTAFKYSLGLGDDLVGVVTADSDGQHAPRDIAAIADRLMVNQARGLSTTVLGTRNLTGSDIPWKSRVGNKITGRVLKALFGFTVSDTQTGLRGFPMNMMASLDQVRGERFEYEMNVLLWLLSTRVPMEEVPIATIYHDVDNSQSHFRPILDSAHIYRVILLQFVRFGSSSLLSAAADLTLFAVSLNLLFGGRADPAGIIWSTVLARIGSSLLNFALNRKLVFHDHSTMSRAMIRYYALSASLMVASAGGATLMSEVFSGHVIWAKVVVDLTLFLVAYLVQKRWVFSRDESLRDRP